MDFYYHPTSAPCRAVLMTAAALRLKMNLKVINLMNKEQLKPEFLKINPQHTIPTLVDNEFSIWESRAISIYLVEKYGTNDSLYPKNAKIRSVINQRLYFDMEMFKRYAEYYFAPFLGREQDPEDSVALGKLVEVLNLFLENNDYVAATTKISVADLALFATISTLEIFEFDFSPYPNVQKWLELMKETAPGADKNSEGIEMMKEMLKAFKQ